LDGFVSLLALKVNHFRNLTNINLELSPRSNLIYGPNGSGKTSLLEAIYFLSMGRSFRSHLANRIIQYGEPSFSIFGTTGSLNIGIERPRQGKIRIKIGNEMVTSVAELAKMLPVQLINPDSYQLLNEGPRYRREFLDWGVFHVEPQFFPLWQRFQRTLKQRNAALQQNASLREVEAWNSEFVIAGEELTRLREHYIHQLLPTITATLAKLITFDNLAVDYYRGWDEGRGLMEVLVGAYNRDRVLGYTQFGPQRADIMVRINGIPAHDVLSRGEQKLLISALRLAQGILLAELTGKQCIYLLDDLAAELDSRRRQVVAELLVGLNAQVFITAVDDVASDLNKSLDAKMFHVEHGAI